MSRPETHVVKLYSRVAGIYDAWTTFTESRSLAVALDRAAIRAEDSVVEVAVGTGVNNNMLGVVPNETVRPILEEILRVLKPGGRFVCRGTRSFAPSSRTPSGITERRS